MTLVYLADSIIPSRSANSVHVMKMCQAFARAGYEVHLIVSAGKKRQLSDVDDVFAFYGVDRCFTLHRIAWPALNKGGRVWAWQAARLAAEIHPDIVYGRSLAACVYAADFGLPVIFEEHRFLWKKRSRFYRLVSHINDGLRSADALAGWAGSALRPRLRSASPGCDARRPDIAIYLSLMRSGGFASAARLYERLGAHPRLLRFVVITHALKTDIAAAHPKIAHKIAVVPDGADLPPKRLPAITFAAEKGVVQVGYCGQLFPGKGMEVIKDLVALCPWAAFHVVGGSDTDLRYWRQALGNYDNIHFYGHVEPHVATAYIDRFDIGLLPNQPSVGAFAQKKIDIGAYTSPLKMFEYMAAGKPIIASNLAVLKEILEHGRNGWLCPHDNAAAWARALEKLAGQPELRQRLGAQAKRDLAELYTWQARARRVLDDRTADSSGG